MEKNMCNAKTSRKEIISMFPELAVLNIPEDGLESQEEFHKLMNEYQKNKVKSQNS
jgi:hypothetical protein